jgi:pyruvate formate lyase activating enzyme
MNGVCRARRNEHGVLTAETYGGVTAIMLDPIEKKPLYHWHPGSSVLSVGGMGCNMTCPWCQNHSIAAPSFPPRLRPLDPKDLPRLAAQARSEAVAYTYNEPLVGYEFVLEACREVRAAGRKNVLVSNGLICPEPMEELKPFLDAANIDIKSFDEAAYKEIGGHLPTVLRSVRSLHEAGVHVEICYPVVAGFNDDVKMFDGVRWIAELSPQIPLHINRTFPTDLWEGSPTPFETLTALRDLAMSHLKYVYVGNVSEPAETFCLSCGTLLVSRTRTGVRMAGLTPDGRCKDCGCQTGIVV